MQQRLLEDFLTFLPYFELIYRLEVELHYEGRSVRSRHGC